MKACGNTAPINIKSTSLSPSPSSPTPISHPNISPSPDKDKWINLERLRWSAQFSIPMRPDLPPSFPPMTLSTQRILSALQLSHPTLLPDTLDALYASIWTPGDFDVRNPDHVSALLAQDTVLGPRVAKQVIEAATGKEAKENLTKNTERAVEMGAFGLPWFQCRDAEGREEGFWGFDHLGQVVRFLGLDGEADGTRGPVRALL